VKSLYCGGGGRRREWDPEAWRGRWFKTAMN